MAAEWREARLIPTSGIKGAIDQEARATSALLSVLTVVPRFAHSMLKSCGAPLGPKRANVKAYTEVAFEDRKNKRSPRPDGLIRVERGSTTWTALVEVKTQTNGLDKDQVESYMDVAKENNFDAVITISNEIPPVLGVHPLDLDKRKLRSMPVYHFSWVRLISLAVTSKEVHGIEDEEQAWILGELIRYLEHENSGALEFEDMGDSWTSVTDAVRTGIVRIGDEGVTDVAARFDGLVRYMALKLGQKLSVDVEPVLSQRERNDPDARTQALASGVGGRPHHVGQDPYPRDGSGSGVPMRYAGPTGARVREGRGIGPRPKRDEDQLAAAPDPAGVRGCDHRGARAA